MDWKNEENKNLVKAILALKTSSETERFLRDLLTEQEIIEFGKRLQTAKMLTNKIPYSTIEQITGLSSTTIARVAKWLNGTGGGYKTIINRLHHHNSSQSRRELS